ncbi:MAG: ComEC/Rec2 family competence protein [Anaerolineae bacterium]
MAVHRLPPSFRRDTAGQVGKDGGSVKAKVYVNLSNGIQHHHHQFHRVAPELWPGERLLTGDAEEGAELRMTASHKELASLVLKVSHHGAKAATGEAFLDAVQPEMAVIQVGADNRFGHPAPEVLARLEGKGAQVLRTDVHGKIEFITDGQSYWVETYRDVRFSIDDNPGRM